MINVGAHQGVIMTEELREIKLELQNLNHQMIAGFARVDERFERLECEMNRRFEEHDRRFDALEKEMRDGFAYISESLSTLMHLPARVAQIEADIAEMKPYFLALKLAS
jgi:hypothetical protein